MEVLNMRLNLQITVIEKLKILYFNFNPMSHNLVGIVIDLLIEKHMI